MKAMPNICVYRRIESTSEWSPLDKRPNTHVEATSSLIALINRSGIRREFAAQSHYGGLNVNFVVLMLATCSVSGTDCWP